MVRDHAWAGDNTVTAVEISINFGVTWQKTSLARLANPYAWQHWKTEITFPGPGYYEVWSRVTDNKGYSQPLVVAWSPRTATSTTPCTTSRLG